MVVYDKAEWHFSSGSFPTDLPPSAAFVRPGMFLGWLAERGLLAATFVQDSGELMSAFRRRDLTGARLYAQSSDGTLDSSMLNDEGNAFTQYYFDKDKGQYREDFRQLLANNAPSLFHVRDSWSNYDQMRARIEERYQAWKARRRGTESPYRSRR